MTNSDALAARAVNIDSRLRVRGEASDCVMQLEEPVHLPRNSVCWLTSASIPYVWPNVAQNVSNKLYITERSRLFSTKYPYQLETVYETYTVTLTSFNYAKCYRACSRSKTRAEPAEAGKC